MQISTLEPITGDGRVGGGQSVNYVSNDADERELHPARNNAGSPPDASSDRCQLPSRNLRAPLSVAQQRKQRQPRLSERRREKCDYR